MRAPASERWSQIRCWPRLLASKRRNWRDGPLFWGQRPPGWQAVVVGGLGSLQGVFIGSGVIGGAETAASTILGGTGGYVTVLVISILFLWLKPGGLYARR